MIIIREASTSDQQSWDAYVCSNPNANPYQLFAWQQAVNKAYGHKSYYLIAENNKQICGVLPCIFIKPPLTKGNLCSLPFCDMGGCLADSEKIKSLLLQYATTLNGRLNGKRFEHREAYISEVANTSLKSNKVSMVLDLPNSSEALLSSFKSKLRSQINKAKKNNLSCDIGSSQDHIEAFYEIFSQNMKRLGSPVHSKKLFEALSHFYDKRLIVSVIKLEDKPIAAGIVLRINNKASIPWASTLFEHNKLSPNMLLYWSLLERLTNTGCEIFDFGRSTPNEGTYKFKSQWGASPKTLNWENIGESEQTVENAGSGNIRAIAETLWAKQPLSTANTLGPFIRKYISL